MYLLGGGLGGPCVAHFLLVSSGEVYLLGGARDALIITPLVSFARGFPSREEMKLVSSSLRGVLGRRTRRPRHPRQVKSIFWAVHEAPSSSALIITPLVSYARGFPSRGEMKLVSSSLRGVLGRRTRRTRYPHQVKSIFWAVHEAPSSSALIITPLVSYARGFPSRGEMKLVSSSL
ncbi:UNVERIFIED_CONTAM: hypothetical protein Slati_0220100 [Sesamum latifolium]|uniref:Uncharacterized protein n=1 Tax=Sesamum latifolium TaxID=2727402 RepID=A0AAW2YC72_9LAMI